MIPRRTLMLLTVGLGIAGIALAQSADRKFPPEKLENLKVLPAEMEVRGLIGVMRGYATALGVRCQHCHVGQEGQALSTFDFVSDEKEVKQKARLMIEMTQAINETHLAQIGVPKEFRLEVRCVTCHHGQSRPETLEEILRTTAVDSGIEAAVAKYRELRDENYGGHSYDFGEFTLIGLAQGLFQEQRPEEAGAFAELNLEFFPKSTMSYGFLAEFHRRQGHLAEAAEAVEKGLEIDPDDRQLGRIKERLETSPN